MKKIITIIAIMVCLGTFTTGCGNSEEDLMGTWCLTDEETGEIRNEKISFYSEGKISENLEIFSDSYGTSYTVTNDEIQFIYYGDVEATAKFKIKGERLELKLKKGHDSEEKTYVFEKEE